MNVIIYGKITITKKKHVCKKCGADIEPDIKSYSNNTLKDEFYLTDHYHLGCVVEMVEEITKYLNDIKECLILKIQEK